MFRRHRQLLASLYAVADLLTTAAAWLAAYAVRFSSLPAPGGVPHFHYVIDALPWVIGLALLAYRFCGLYDTQRLGDGWRELVSIGMASGFLFLLIIAATFYRRDLYESRLALGMFLVLNVAGLIIVRQAVWRGLRAFRPRLLQTRAVIIGAGRTGRVVARTLRNQPWLGLELVGYVDRPAALAPADLPLLGDIPKLAQVVAEHDISQVFVALPLGRYGELPEIYAMLGDLLVEVQIVPDIPSLSGMRPRLTDIQGVPFMGLRERPIVGLHRVGKRIMDLSLGTAALMLLAPLLLLLAAAVKLTSRGPVFYRQSRAGLDGQPFEMWKFRSMRIDAEQTTGPVWARRHDDRCTPLGRFMRKWGLDELPQLFNVLAGDMSLVGPRPERGVFIEKFRRQIPCYTQRHQVKAGITGWAQVHGWRGNTSLRRRVECDLYYICNWSLWLDWKILVMTLWAGFRHRNGF